MNVHEKWLSNLKSFKGNLTLPPPTLNELGLEYLEIDPGKKMVAKVPFQKRFTNPVGLYQGGMLTAAIDEVFGPLSYITAGNACMTLSMHTTFLSPFKEDMNFCTIEATVLKATKNFIFMQAVVLSSSGELLAQAQSHVKVIK
jgi:uncharacterized protein (TIGR00369 family)